MVKTLGKKLGDRLRCPKPPRSRIIHAFSTARGQRCLSPSFFGWRHNPVK